MKKAFFLFTVIFSFCLAGLNSNAQDPNWLWAKSAGGVHDDEANAVDVDDSGNVYLAGSFYSSSIIFDSTILTNGVGSSIFLAKFNIDGNLLWANSIGGEGNDEAFSICVDKSGNSFLVGNFTSSTITFGSTTLINMGSRDIFLVKFDTYGNVLWAKSAGGSNFDRAKSVTVDSSGNIYVTGTFLSQTIRFDSTTLINAGVFDVFLAKFDGNGNVLWAKSAGGTSDDYGATVSIDTTGKIYIAGFFNSTTLSIGSTTLTNINTNNTSDIFLAKYDANGNLLWAKRAGGTGNDGANSIAVDISGNISIAGYFYSTSLAFGSTALFNSSADRSNIFLAKYDGDGFVIWATSSGGTSNDEANAVSIDASGNTYMTGWFGSSTITFGNTILTSEGVDDIFIVKYDAAGNVLWAKSAGGTYYDRAHSVHVNSVGNVLVAGVFMSPMLSFDTTTFLNAGYWDIFLVRLNDSSHVGINELNNSLYISVFPNPAKDCITIIIPEISSIEISNIAGQIVKIINYSRPKSIIDLSNLAQGVYVIKAISGKNIAVEKFIKQ